MILTTLILPTSFDPMQDDQFGDDGSAGLELLSAMGFQVLSEK